MITVRAGSGAIGVCLMLLASGCSREQQDWRSAESADTIEAYGHFIQRHPESELATQARTRVAQLGEDRDWQHAGSADTVDAYRQFIAEHPNGKWAQEARIRIENFSLGEQAGTDAASKHQAGGGGPGAGGGAAGGATAGAAHGHGVASPGESASPAGATPSVAGRGPGSGTAAGARSFGLASPGEEAVPAGPPPSGARTAAAGGQPGPGDSRAAAAARAAGAPGPAGAAEATGSGGQPGAAGRFGIQLGAFSSEAGAHNEWRVLTGRFGPELQGLHEHLVVVDAASGRIYRLQATVGDEARARAICSSLRNRGQGCVAVLPH